MGQGEIRRHPDPVLRREAKPVHKVNRQVREMLDDMMETMRRARGVGLAAPQVGISRRVIVVDVGDGPIELINPEIVHAEGTDVAVEGCLSVPGLIGEVPRYRKVTVSGLNRTGHRTWIEAEGLLARALQHEIDHLNGVLFVDRATEVREVVPAPAVVFLGTGTFAVPVLREICARGYEVLAVITQPDRRQGRGLQLASPPVKLEAGRLGLEVEQPESIRTEEFLARIRQSAPDFLVVADFGRILPPDLLRVGKAVVNLHPSLLPRWRGPAPIERALMAGDEVTGVTTQHVSERVDAGDIILQKEVPISPEDTAGTLRERLAREGATLMVETLGLLSRGEDPRRPQDEALATYAAAIRPQDEIIAWNENARQVVNRVRALEPVPGARTFWYGSLMKVRKARLYEGPAGEGSPGQVVALTEEGFVVAAGDGQVLVTEVQPAGKNRMGAADFLRGYPLRVGDRLQDRPEEEGS